MSYVQIKLVGTGLAMLYGFVAVLGYGVHSFIAYDAKHCEELVCGKASGPVGTHLSADDTCFYHEDSTPSFCHVGNRTKLFVGPLDGSPQSQHDPNTCPVCVLLKQLRMGYAVAYLPPNWFFMPVQFTPKPTSVFSRPSIRLGETRGPPLQAV